jgi:hypothetical protein
MRRRNSESESDAGKVCRADADKGSRQWARLAALSRRQDGVFSVEQLGALGFERRRLPLLVQQGRFVRRHRGVYADALVKPTQRAHLLGALLALGDTAFLSRRTALALHGVRLVNLRGIEVTVIAEHTPRHRGLVVHRTSIPPDDSEICTRDGLTTASAALALVETAGRESDAELDRLIAGLARRRSLDLERIDAVIARRSGLRGVTRLRAALARYRPSNVYEDASTLERDFAAWLATHPEIPPPQRNVRVGPWEFDFFWPHHGVVLETDGGPYHTISPDLERDRLKDAWVQRRKMAILRVTGFRFEHDRAGVRSDLLALLDLHSARS